MTPATVERRLRTSAALVMGGIVIEMVSFSWHHPTAFLLFLIVGGALMAAGILWYLLTLANIGGAR